MSYQILETYNPPKVLWEFFNEVTSARLLAKILNSGCTVPVGLFQGPDGKYTKSLSEFHETEHAALKQAVKDHTAHIANLDKQREQLGRDIKISRRKRFEYQLRLKEIN